MKITNDWTPLSGLAWGWALSFFWSPGFWWLLWLASSSEIPQVVPITRTLGLTFPISAFHCSICCSTDEEVSLWLQAARNGPFHQQRGHFYHLGLAGFWGWSLIYRPTGRYGGRNAGLLVDCPLAAEFRFQSKLVSSLLGYGTKVIAIEGLGILMLNADYLLIGRYMTVAALEPTPWLFASPNCWSNSSATSSATSPFPFTPNYGHASLKFFQRGFLKTMRYMTLLTIPMGLGLALVSRPFCPHLLYGKTTDAIPVMSAISLYTLLRSLVFNAGSVYKATGWFSPD